MIERAERVPYLSIAGTVNMAGGQPISMANLRAVREIADRHGIMVIFDATRAVENAYFIQEREPGYADRSVAEILREMCDLTDGCTMSAKKDSLVNIGGWIGLHDPDLAAQARNLCVVYEGLHTYGGLAGRDLEAIAVGIEESVDDDHIRARILPGPRAGGAARGGRRADRGADRRPRRVPRRPAHLPAPPAGAIPGPAPRGRDLPGLGHADDGARHRLGRPRPGDGGAPAPGPRARPDHDPAARLHVAAPAAVARSVADVSTSAAETRASRWSSSPSTCASSRPGSARSARLIAAALASLSGGFRVAPRR